MRKRFPLIWILLGAGILVTGILQLATRYTPGSPDELADKGAPQDQDQAAPTGTKPYVITNSPFTREYGKADSTISRDLEVLQLTMSEYRLLVKNHADLPFGNNQELMARLLGKNNHLTSFIPPDHPMINAAGELVDRWGTPLHIHPLSSKRVEIRSAGPDKKMWTRDDVVNDPRPKLPPRR